MRPIALHSKIFLDGANPVETEEIINLLGFLDGQTTNPSLFAKNLFIQERIDSSNKFTKEQLLEEYKNIIQDIKEITPKSLISIEVYCDENTKSSEMISQALEMNTWIENAYIKLPITREGLKAANSLCKKGINLNMTLCFTQEQAAAVYAATIDAEGDVLISPFQGRLDDNCKDGTDLIMNIQRMYSLSDKHVKIVNSSIRDYTHFLYALYTKTEYITAPFNILNEWANNGLEVPGVDIDEDIFKDKTEYFKDIHNACIVGISYKEIDLSLEWGEYNISSDLTTQGIKKFSEDWNALLKS